VGQLECTVEPAFKCRSSNLDDVIQGTNVNDQSDYNLCQFSRDSFQSKEATLKGTEYTEI